MLLWCPKCHAPHVDEGIWATRPHKTHLCSSYGCGHTWRPANIPTVGVLDLPQDWLQAARARCNDATPGPWETTELGTVSECPDGIEPDCHESTFGTELVKVLEGRSLGDDQLEKNWEFVDHARMDLPHAIDTTEAADAVIELLTTKQQCDHCGTIHRPIVDELNSHCYVVKQRLRNAIDAYRGKR